MFFLICVKYTLTFHVWHKHVKFMFTCLHVKVVTCLAQMAFHKAQITLECCSPWVSSRGNSSKIHRFASSCNLQARLHFLKACMVLKLTVHPFKWINKLIFWLQFNPVIKTPADIILPDPLVRVLTSADEAGGPSVMLGYSMLLKYKYGGIYLLF